MKFIIISFELVSLVINYIILISWSVENKFKIVKFATIALPRLKECDKLRAEYWIYLLIIKFSLQ